MACSFASHSPGSRRALKRLAVVMVAGAGFAAGAIANDIQVVAVSNLAAPGGPEGSRFSQFSSSFRFLNTTINALGQTAFRADMSQFYGGVTLDDNQGIWAGTPGDLDLLVREGGSASPAVPGAVFSSFSSTVVINDQGRVLFSGGLEADGVEITSVNDGGLWSAGPEGIQAIVRQGDQAPGAPEGALFATLVGLSDDSFDFNDAGETAFYASLRFNEGIIDATNNTGYWRSGRNGLEMLAGEGVQAPGVEPGAVFENFSTSGFLGTLNNAGQVAFRAPLRQGAGGVTSSNDMALWTDLDGEVELLAREGDEPVGLPGARYFSFGEPPRLNDSGHLLYLGFLQAGYGGVTSSTDEGLWSNRSGQYEPIYLAGDDAPGVPSGRFESFYWYTLNNEDKVAIVGKLADGFGGVTEDNDRALWVEEGSDLRLVAREGSPAPDVPGAVFDNVGGLALMNGRGQVAFQGSLRLGFGGVTADNDGGIWATDADGVLQLVAREGDTVEVAPGDFRTFTDLRFFADSGGADGQRSPFSDNGELVFWADLNSFDGIFLSTQVAVEGLPGDYNGDGVVNAADYTVWRDGGSPSGPVPSDYQLWSDNYGASAPAQVVADAVPEPAAGWLVAAVVGVLAGEARRRDCSSVLT